ncbi:protein ACCELERATED CELL DEATH 6-like [Juglans regia]|uniref:Protein ACCELERATED CELL DEATH 6-like n=1 Tax=Juglans regia TaxID=51240 RepID=A0A6P9F502_JUGRE|nr:protein ACCELERATED CELL DEATH 6-like [Juglans regia]
MIITCMGPILYDAAAKGNIMAFKDDSFKRPLEALLTPNKNTVLHIFITTLKNGIESTENNFVGDILNMCPSLLCQVNVKDETPLHVAARYGHTNIVEVLIEHAKHPHHQDLGSRADAVRKMLRMVNKEKDTALHEAVRYNHLQVVKLLINDDPGFSYSVNDAGETPLYIAVERNYKNLVLEILNTCNSPAYDGPDGRTALHAAVFWDNKDCCELVDNRGWNALHFTVEGNWPDSAMELIIKNSSLSNLLNEKDAEGNTPLHYQYSRCFEYGKKDLMDHPRVDKMAFNKKNLNAYQVALISEKLSTKKKKEIETKSRSHSRRIFIKDEVDEISEDKFKDIEKKSQARMKEYLEKAAEAHLVVASLITTVTFAAAITMPGGFVGTGGDPHDHEGSAVLRRNAAFKVFIIRDAISLVLSSSAVVTHLLMPLLLIKYYRSDETRYAFLRLAFRFILMAMGAMVLAFVTGAYAVLAHYLDLAVTTYIIGSCFFLILSLIFGMYGKVG